ncbi:hypothetical protein HAX54_038649, partial [Datura stramonium]|nr:hypothetical protein [Datura stramonium]
TATNVVGFPPQETVVAALEFVAKGNKGVTARTSSDPMDADSGPLQRDTGS